MKQGGAIGVRMATAAILLTLVLTLIWVPSLRLGLAVFVAALVLIGLHEYYAMARAAGLDPERMGGMVAGACVALSGGVNLLFGTTLAFLCACVLVMALHVVRGRRSIADMAASVFGVCYVGWFGAHIMLLHGIPQTGPGLTTLLLMVVALTDAGAYLVGRSLGRHKMAPVLSPNKTWEGAAAGFLAALAGMALLWAVGPHLLWMRFPACSLVRYLYTGAVLSAVAQMGDLAESSLKRAAGIKDSGNFLPGHGGVLDRCDGYLFAAPVLYYMSAPILF